MTLDRRRFVKLAGLAALLGAGGAGWELLRPGAVDAAEMEPNRRALTAKRWGMVIDMAKFTPETLKASMDTCHYHHNVPQIGTNQNIKWIWTAPYINVFPETENPHANEQVLDKDFITMCNHCDNPPCVRVCPTKATFRREDGIVMMDMHRCIGCRFCMAACPYGSRSFNFMDPRPHLASENKLYPTRMKGVVEKCTFCTERLAVGQLPYCVEASQGAMIFGDMDDPSSVVRMALRERFSIRRKPNLGTLPQVFYLV